MSFPKFILILLVFILGLHVIASVNHWYWTYEWFDMPMHFLGGFWLAAVFFWLNSKFKVLEIPPFSIPKFVMVLGFVILVGVLWEFYEFLCDLLILNGHYLQMGAADTIGDLFFDLVGGSAFVLVFLKKLTKYS